MDDDHVIDTHGGDYNWIDGFYAHVENYMNTAYKKFFGAARASDELKALRDIDERRVTTLRDGEDYIAIITYIPRNDTSNGTLDVRDIFSYSGGSFCDPDFIEIFAKLVSIAADIDADEISFTHLNTETRWFSKVSNAALPVSSVDPINKEYAYVQRTTTRKTLKNYIARYRAQYAERKRDRAEFDSEDYANCQSFSPTSQEKRQRTQADAAAALTSESTKEAPPLEQQNTHFQQVQQSYGHPVYYNSLVPPPPPSPTHFAYAQQHHMGHYMQQPPPMPLHQYGRYAQVAYQRSFNAQQPQPSFVVAPVAQSTSTEPIVCAKSVPDALEALANSTSESSAAPPAEEKRQVRVEEVTAGSLEINPNWSFYEISAFGVKMVRDGHKTAMIWFDYGKFPVLQDNYNFYVGTKNRENFVLCRATKVVSDKKFIKDVVAEIGACNIDSNRNEHSIVRNYMNLMKRVASKVSNGTQVRPIGVVFDVISR